MNEKTFRVLEFDKVVHLLVNEAQTNIGKQLSANIKPETSIEKVQKLHNETDEAVTIIRLNRAVPLGGITDIREALKRTLIGSTLSATECLNIGTTIYGGRQTKNFIDDMEEDLPLLKDYVYQISPLYELEKQITSAIDENGYVMDSAYVKLRGIRSSIRYLESRVRERLINMTRLISIMLSESFYTFRNYSQILPVIRHEIYF